MPVQVDDLSALQQYLDGVVNRADHHADNVNEVVFPLIGAILYFKDPKSSIKVFARQGATGNVLWVSIGKSKYPFSYDHKSASIALKRGGTQGKVIARFTNATETAEIIEHFRKLSE
jgi:hypothetical protein